ncbi:MAG: hypothetical protein HY907_04105 [Deltaproteobacteria bacterium]|nr:hypothetical protein [Deltaproteobacteria bacterium]
MVGTVPFPSCSPRRLRLVLCGFALASSCAEAQVNFSETQTHTFQPSDYERVVERWTRDEQLYILDGLDNALTVSATFESWEYRQAYIDRYAYDFRLTDLERQELESEQRAELETAHVFVIAASSTKVEWSDLTADATPWKIRLVNDQGDVLEPFPEGHAPRGIEEVRRITPAQRLYFPYINDFRTVYVLRFPRTMADGTPFLRAGVEAFTLEFAGVLGRAELRWSSASE